MSYTRSMTGEVYWSTSGSVSYPASESGGSVPYHDSGSVPITINVHVDTTSFDGSVAFCGASLATLGGSVKNAGVEQCQAIESSSESVSRHITDGFFSLIKSDLSQNMAHLIAKVTSAINLLNQKAKLLKDEHKVMENDYKRVFARYNEIFSSLDEECKKRIMELDKQAYRLSRDVFIKQLTTGPAMQTSKLLTFLGDTSKTQQQLLAAHTKRHAATVITDISENATSDEHYKKVIASVVRPGEVKPVFIPMPIGDYLDIESGKGRITCYFVKDCQDKDLHDSIIEKVKDYVFENEDFGRDYIKDEAVENRFYYFCDSALGGEENKRVRELAKSLFRKQKKG